MALKDVPASKPPSQSIGSSGPPGAGRGGRGGGSGEFGRFLAQALQRLNDAGITTDRSFDQELERFLVSGIEKARQQNVSLEQFESAWEQFIEAMIRFADETQTTHFDLGIFRSIHDRLCPGFFPFC